MVSVCEKCAFCAGRWGLQAHLDDEEVCRNRIVTLKAYLQAGKMMVDPQPKASIYSHGANGLGRDESKWEIPV